jgi:hypothetical protein
VRLARIDQIKSQRAKSSMKNDVDHRSSAAIDASDYFPERSHDPEFRRQLDEVCGLRLGKNLGGYFVRHQLGREKSVLYRKKGPGNTPEPQNPNLPAQQKEKLPD